MKTTMKKLCLLAIAGSVLGIAPALAQKQAPPEGGPPKAFTVPANETYTLPNGLKITLVPYGIIPNAPTSLAVDPQDITTPSPPTPLPPPPPDLLHHAPQHQTPHP